MAELTERAVASRVPSLLDQPLKAVGRRDPVAVRPGRRRNCAPQAPAALDCGAAGPGSVPHGLA